MDEKIGKCKKCFLYELADKAAYESVKSYLDAMPEADRAEEALYRRRLKICRECESFLAAMCRKCGCYVEIRAARKDAHCPSGEEIW